MPEPFRTVLCPVDFTSLSERTVHLAAELCRRMKARLVLHHNLQARPPGYLGVGWMAAEEGAERNQQKEQEVPEKLRQVMAEMPEGLDYEAKLTHAPLDSAVLEVARLLPADLIIMGSHGWSTPAHRSLTEKIILKAPCTVLTTGETFDPEAWFAPRGDRPEELPVLLPVDFSPRTRDQLAFAFDLARWMPHQLHLLNVVPEEAPATRREAAAARLEELVPTDLAGRVRVRVGSGRPAPVILEVARETGALFVLLAAHRRGPLRRLLFGTTTLELLHDGRCPVWFVPERWRSGERGTAAGGG